MKLQEADWLVELPKMLTSQHRVCDPTDWPRHNGARHFYLTLPIWSFDVRCECRINLSACERHTINCWIPPIQNTQIDLTEEASCTLLVSCYTDLDYWVVFVNRVDVFLEHMHRTLKASERFMPNFPVISFYFACLLVLIVSTTTAATIT